MGCRPKFLSLSPKTKKNAHTHKLSPFPLTIRNPRLTLFFLLKLCPTPFFFLSLISETLASTRTHSLPSLHLCQKSVFFYFLPHTRCFKPLLTGSHHHLSYKEHHYGCIYTPMLLLGVGMTIGPIPIGYP